MDDILLHISKEDNYIRINDTTYLPWNECDRIAAEARADERELIAKALEKERDRYYQMVARQAFATAAKIARGDQ